MEMKEKEFNQMMDKREEDKLQKEKMKKFEQWEKNQSSLPNLPKFDIPNPPNPSQFKPQEPMATSTGKVSAMLLPNSNLKYKNQEYVGIVTAAIMVIKIRKTLSYACLGGIIGSFLVLALSIFGFTAGSGMVILMVAAYVFLLMNNKKEMQYLSQKYNV